MTEYVTTTEAAAALKTALRAQYPGVKFSVRKDRGTACAWLRVTYTDGPTDRAVQTIADRYSGQRFNARPTSTTSCPTGTSPSTASTGSFGTSWTE